MKIKLFNMKKDSNCWIYIMLYFSWENETILWLFSLQNLAYDKKISVNHQSLKNPLIHLQWRWFWFYTKIKPTKGRDEKYYSFLILLLSDVVEWIAERYWKKMKNGIFILENVVELWKRLFAPLSIVIMEKCVSFAFDKAHQ